MQKLTIRYTIEAEGNDKEQIMDKARLVMIKALQDNFNVDEELEMVSNESSHGGNKGYQKYIGKRYNDKR